MGPKLPLLAKKNDINFSAHDTFLE